MRPTLPLLTALALLATGVPQSASAQYDDEDYGGRPPPRRSYEYEERYERPRRSVGLNCDAVQSGLSGLQPYSCPLPGPRPLGSRCFCDLPIVPFNGPQTAVGRVAP